LTNKQSRPRVGLFVTCLADLYRPSVAFAAVKLLEDAGAIVEVPRAQTCCGQPAFNNGDLGHVRTLAKQVIEVFADFDYVVAPSGSCMGTIKTHYVELFEDDPDGLKKAQDLAERSHEVISFLTDVMGISDVDAHYDGAVTYHDSCAGLRELGIREQPRRLLDSVQGLTLNELEDSNVCCGFGGTFCAKYPEISGRMVDDKCTRIEESGADTVLGGDLGCLLNITGRLRRTGQSTRAFHVTEVLAGMTDGPGIGDGEG